VSQSSLTAVPGLKSRPTRNILRARYWVRTTVGIKVGLLFKGVGPTHQTSGHWDCYPYVGLLLLTKLIESEAIKREEPLPCPLRVIKRRHSLMLCPLTFVFDHHSAVVYYARQNQVVSHTTWPHSVSSLRKPKDTRDIVIFPHRSQYQLKLSKPLGIQ